jgi:predicted 3-demethylubiquinone-9 3-methyltransferase (glyoxalase superfamily)
MTVLQGGACGITSARSGLPANFGRQKMSNPMSEADRAVRPPASSTIIRNSPMSKISPCLWFDGEAEQAANFYVALLPDSKIEHIQKNSVDSPAGKAGSVLVVEFTLAGQRFMALNGGKAFDFTHAISFKIDCADQAEVDRYWDALSQGGSVERCGWLKDRFGVSWQIVPSALPKYLGGPDRAGAQRAMQAMMGMVKLDIAGLKQAYEGKPAA